MHTSFFSDIIVRKPALFRAMLSFNGRLDSAVPDCPEEWRVPGLDAAVVAAELSRRGSPVLAWPVAPPEEGFLVKFLYDEEPWELVVGPRKAVLRRMGHTRGFSVKNPSVWYGFLEQAKQ